MKRLPPWRAALPWLAASALLAGAACLDDGGVGPDGSSARLALRAQFGAVAVTGIRLEGEYRRSDQSIISFPPQSLPLPADRSPGAQATLPVTLDLAACLADPLAVPGDGACTLVLALVLLDGSREVDRVVIGPLVLRPGQTATPAPVELREAANVDVTGPSSSSCIRPGQTLQLSARLLDAAGDELTGRPFAWASATPAVATVDAASGLVTGVAEGSSVVTATAGGRTGEFTVTVCPLARIVLAPTAVSFEGFAAGERPAAAQVAVRNGESGPLAGLTLGSITYSSGATGWLSATLSAGTAPTTLRLQPSSTDLPDGTHTAVVPVVSEGASNSPQSVTVTYRVRDVSDFFLFIEEVGETSGFIFSGEELELRALLFDQSENEVDDEPVSWNVSPSNAGSFSPSSRTGEVARYVAGSYQGTVRISASVGPLSETFEIQQNSVTLRLAPRTTGTPRTSTTPARTRPPGGTP